MAGEQGPREVGETSAREHRRNDSDDERSIGGREIEPGMESVLGGDVATRSSTRPTPDYGKAGS